MDFYKQVFRLILFRLDAETAHNLAKAVLKHPSLGWFFGCWGRTVKDPRLEVRLGDLTIPNPVGLAAGFDKDCDMLTSLGHFGFGYLVAGSVMSNSRPGNPKPRMIRDLKREGLYSSMGLPSRGIDYAVKQLKCRRLSTPLIINFNADGLEDYLKSFEILQPWGDGIEIALFCPNRTHGAGDFLSAPVAKTLLKEISKRKEKPLFIKFQGYRSEEERLKRWDLIKTILQYPVDGITISPGSLVNTERLAVGRGTLTGRPNFQRTLSMVRDVYAFTEGRCHIKASGGIFTAEDAFKTIGAGASSVEIHTGLIYEGWRVAKNINRGMLDLLDKHQIEDLKTLRGSIV